ncbi:MAG: phosphoribosylglycinamide formyltransferase [uncultured bacterium]|nr:MAG: phosphoribosylglycinamide formyltransferase [uncultured bacterium]OGT55823.1 MAG: phosphoribosylglycinamide formyltransferase [Gammaproteobacteria bacterium RIFCSPHIGHO2_12_FULL_42_10]
MINLAILGSTRGSSMLPIIEAIRQGRLSANIKIIISNKVDAMILERAETYHLPHLWLDAKGCTREEYDQKISAVLQQQDVQLVLLIGYMRILSESFVTEWQDRLLNVHPSLLPAFAGKMDLEVHRAVLEAGVKETGCTVHLVTQEVDAGPIVVQKRCLVLATDTAESLKARVQGLEGEALVEAVQRFCDTAYNMGRF